jgi:hypothetical protein
MCVCESATEKAAAEILESSVTRLAYRGQNQRPRYILRAHEVRLPGAPPSGGRAGARPRRPDRHSRPVDDRPVQQQVLHLRHRRRLAGLGRRLDVAAGHNPPASRSGAGRHPHWRSVLRVRRRQHRRAAQGGGQHDLDPDARPGIPRLQMGRGRGGRFVGRRRGQQRDRSGGVPRSERRPAVAGLRLLLRLHPPRRARFPRRARARTRTTHPAISRSTARPPP